MAKKKASAKKASPKKAVKKAAVQKTLKKAAPKPKKVSKPAAKKKIAKKVAVKKASPKKAAAKKPVVKKSATKSEKSAPLFAMAKPAEKAAKLVDLSNFVTPLDDRLIVQVAAAERMTAGGLYIPDSVSDVSGNLQGVVVSVGRGHFSKKGHLHPMDVKVGDKVVFSQYSGSKINLKNQELIILRETEVMGVVSK